MIELRPITRAAADAFIRAKHRHHGPTAGALWRHAIHDEAGLTGVAIVGRPVARALNDGRTVEVTRLCTDGIPNGCSMLYAAARRVADAMGYRRGLTYILKSEWERFDQGRRVGGRSVLAAGYRFLWQVDGRSWDCASRPRVDKHPTEDKIALGWGAWDLSHSVSHAMTAKERDDLQIWIRHGRIGTGRGYQAEVARARQIEAEQLTAYQRPEGE